MAEVTLWHPRYLSNRIYFFAVDASISFPILGLIIHPRLYSLWSMLIFIAFLFVLSRKGFTPMASINYTIALIGQFFGRGRRPSGSTLALIKREHYTG